MYVEPTAIPFLVCWAVLPVVWHYFMAAIGLSLLRPTLPSFSILGIYLFQYLGLPILFFGLDAYRYESGVTDQAVILLVWLFTSLTITSMLTGFAVAHFAFGSLAPFPRLWRSRSSIDERQRLLVLSYGSLGAAVLLIYVSILGTSNIALLAVLGGSDAASLALARSGMGNDFPGGYHWYVLFMRDVLQFAWLVLFVDRLLKPSLLKTISLVVLGCFLAMSLLMATEKAPVAFFLIAVMLAYIWAKHEGRLSLRIAILFAAALVLLLAGAYILFMGDAGLLAALWSIVSRGLAGSIHPAYFYLEIFPRQVDWLQGLSFPNPGGVLPFVPYEMTVEVMNRMDPASAEKGIVGTAPTVFWGEVYANFGPLCVPIGGLLVGIWLYLLNKIVFRCFSAPVGVAFFAWLMMHYLGLAVTSLSVFVIDIPLIVVTCLALMVQMRIVRAAAAGTPSRPDALASTAAGEVARDFHAG